ncbi:hypothetical protein [Archangium lipolyticum]|uniref:hypothetical protein n=1 Tax=Archangium lipolyticum TaxID=2970465 RepID=UPI00214A8A4D|nr:hypothetical protein [Archangium lipolyticum]
MKTSRRVVGLLLVLTVGTAVAQAAPTLAARLRGLASYYGDSQGRIPVTLDTGEVLYVSTSESRAPFSIYTAGAPVSDGAQVAACGLDAAGRAVACDPAYDGAVLNGLQYLQHLNPDPTGVRVQCEEDDEGFNRCKFVWHTCVVCSPTECTPIPC